MSSDLKYVSGLPTRAAQGFFGQFLATEDNTPYFAALGKFVIEYGAAEIALHEYARKLSGLTQVKAPIVFGKMRVKDITDRIRMLMHLEPVEPHIYKRIDACIIHLDLISDKRGKLVHQMVTLERPSLFAALSPSAHFRVENVLGKAIPQTQEEIFSIDDLHNMTIDCMVINLRIESVRNAHIFENKSPERMSFLHCAWLYKPVQQNPQTKRRVKARKERKLRRPLHKHWASCLAGRLSLK